MVSRACRESVTHRGRARRGREACASRPRPCQWEFLRGFVLHGEGPPLRPDLGRVAAERAGHAVGREQGDACGPPLADLRPAAAKRAGQRADAAVGLHQRIERQSGLRTPANAAARPASTARASSPLASARASAICSARACSTPRPARTAAASYAPWPRSAASVSKSRPAWRTSAAKAVTRRSSSRPSSVTLATRSRSACEGVVVVVSGMSIPLANGGRPPRSRCG